MELKVIKSELEETKAFRTLFLKENNFQFIYNKCHENKWADTYLFIMDEIKIGYGSVWGESRREDRDSIFEFYIIKSYRKHASKIFQTFLSVSGASNIVCQSNDSFLSSMLFEHAQDIHAEAMLFEDHFQTAFNKDGVTFQRESGYDPSLNTDHQYTLKHHEKVIATGGLMLNYNLPYADLYYEVKENFRQNGFGSFMVQELKKAAYIIGRVPAARCNIRNQISKATLLKSGFIVCGHLLIGKIAKLS